MKYNWQHKNWPCFTYVASKIDAIALDFAMETGVVKGMIDGLTEEEQQETILQWIDWTKLTPLLAIYFSLPFWRMLTPFA